MSGLPPRPSLEQLRKQAKELLRGLRAGEPAALARLRAHSSAESPVLADAQFVLAREHGFESWSKLVRHVEAVRPLGPLGLSTTPPFYRVDLQANRIMPRGPLSEADWDTIFAVMKEIGITGLSDNGLMTDRAMERLAALDQVTRLSLEGSSLTDDGLKHLASMPQLQELELGGQHSRITDRGLDVLGQLPELRRFHAGWAKGITDAGVANLAACEHLESVDLMGTATGDGAISALTGKRKLCRFKSGRLVTDAGLPLLHELPVFKTWQGGEEEFSLMSNDCQPNHLQLDGSFTGLAGLAGLDGLFGFSLFWFVTALKGRDLAPLADLPHLGYLGCEGKLCDDEAMGHIAAIPTMRMMMGQGTVASDVGFGALSRSRSIEFLWGRECPNLTGGGFAALAAMPALKGLAVSCKHVDDAGLSALPRFPALRGLMPMDVPDAGFEHVGGCEQLEELWCMYCKDTGDAATGHLRSLSRLKTYYAGATQITDRSLEMLGRMASLESIELSRCAGITDAGIAALARLPRLREVTVGGSPGVTRAGAEVFPAHVRVSYGG